MRSKRFFATLVAGAVCAAVAHAQPPAPPAPPAPADADRLVVLGNVAPLPALGGSIDIIGSQGGVPGPVVKGKPYSARSITESTRVLADGNRIVQRNEAVIYRDGEGRTRREQTLSGLGPWAAGEPVTLIHIHDPVADKSYALDPATRTAREIRRFQMAIAQTIDAPGGAGAGVFYAPEPPEPPRPPNGDPGVAVEQGVTIVRRVGDIEQVQVFSAAPLAADWLPAGTAGMYEEGEDLGEQVLEGLLVRGTRMVDTIPAGTIGNERPIEIVTERWYSEDIDALVLQRFSDPRFGETVYKLVNVVRGEPSPDLFQVPQGYEIVAADAPRPSRLVTGTAGEPVQLQFRRLEPPSAGTARQ